MTARSNCGETCSLCVSCERVGIGVFEFDFSNGGGGELAGGEAGAMSGMIFEGELGWGLRLGVGVGWWKGYLGRGRVDERAG